MLKDAYKKSPDCGDIKPTCDDIKGVLSKLKNEGRKLVVVTTDNYEITYKCLDELGIKEFFDAIFADDGTTPTKPDPTCILKYCKECGISIDNAIMVGDTMTDVKFARNAGMTSVGVGSSEKNRQRLMPYADFVIKDVSYIHDVIKELEK